MATFRKLPILLIFCEIFFHRFAHSEDHVDFYKRHHLIQVGERTFACVSRPIELNWKYHYADHVKTVWKKQRGSVSLTVASWSNNVFTLDPLAVSAGVSPGKYSNNGCCGLVLNYVEKTDDATYIIEVTTTDPDAQTKTGNTTLYVYDDCPTVSKPQLSISCDADSGSSPVKRTNFTYRDIVDLSVAIQGNPVVQRRFYYQEQQHRVIQQLIRAKCYNSDNCDVVKWTMSKKSLSLAFFSRISYLNMTLFARLYHKKALLDVVNTTFQIIDPDFAVANSLPRCKVLETLPAVSVRWDPVTWNVFLWTSLTFAVSNCIHQISLLS